MGSTRDLVIADLVATILAVDPAGKHRTRVCLDGITASGKTTLADEVAAGIAAAARPVLRVTMDGFHHPRAHRHRQGLGRSPARRRARRRRHLPPAHGGRRPLGPPHPHRAGVRGRTRARRGAARDAELLGGIEAARVAFDDRYHAACRRYLAEVDPESRCDVLVDNADPATPSILGR